MDNFLSFYRVIVTKGNVELMIINVLNSGLAVGFRLIFLLMKFNMLK